MSIRRKFYFLALSLIPLLLILRIPALTQQTQMMSQTLLKPFLSVGNAVSSTAGDFTENFFLFWKTFEEQQHNKQVIVALENRLEKFEEMRRENERLRELLTLRQELKIETIAARVIGWDVSPWRLTVILDKGEKQGVKEDMPVVVPQGLAGRVVEAGMTTARAILLTDPDSRVSALAADSRSQGMIAGDGSGTLEMKYLDLDSGVGVGETVLSSGVTGLFPKGLRIGRIESVERDTDGLHLVAKVAPFVPMRKLEEVLCIASSATR